MAANYTITITSITVRKFDAPTGFYTPNTERYTYRAQVNGVDQNGVKRFFYADSVDMAVTAGPGCAVVTFNRDKAAQFLNIPENYVAMRGHKDNNVVTAKFNAGDVVTLRATDKNGKLERVKLI